MTGSIPVLRTHLVIAALAVLTALGPPIGHAALQVLENRLLQTTGAGRGSSQSSDAPYLILDRRSCC